MSEATQFVRSLGGAPAAALDEIELLESKIKALLTPGAATPAALADAAGAATKAVQTVAGMVTTAAANPVGTAEMAAEDVIQFLAIAGSAILKAKLGTTGLSVTVAQSLLSNFATWVEAEIPAVAAKL